MKKNRSLSVVLTTWMLVINSYMTSTLLTEKVVFSLTHSDNVEHEERKINCVDGADRSSAHMETLKCVLHSSSLPSAGLLGVVWGPNMIDLGPGFLSFPDENIYFSFPPSRITQRLLINTNCIDMAFWELQGRRSIGHWNIDRLIGFNMFFLN